MYTFCLKGFLQASYSLLLFLLLVRCLHLLRPFRFVRHFGRILSTSISSLLACWVSSSLFSLNANKFDFYSLNASLSINKVRNRAKFVMRQVSPCENIYSKA